MNWKSLIKESVPAPLLNRALLTCPFLYSWKAVNYETNLPPEGIADLLSQLESALGLEGDIVECGSSRCGASVIMARRLQARRSAKRIYACDSFEGFDLAELRREKTSGLTDTPDDAFTSTSYRYVQAKLAKLGCSDTVIPVRGFFQDTLPRLDVKKVCFALIDCDLRDSLVFCAENLWSRLVAGGRLLFDDYASAEYQGARVGIETFVERHANEIASHGLLDQLYFVEK
jgi:O-methyltransferase